MRIEEEVHLDLPPAYLFDRLSDPSCFAEAAAAKGVEIERLPCSPAGRPRFRIAGEIGGRRREGVLEIVATTPNRRIEAHLDGEGFAADIATEIAPAPDGARGAALRIALRIRFRSLTARLARPAVALAAPRVTEKLKRRAARLRPLLRADLREWRRGREAAQATRSRNSWAG